MKFIGLWIFLFLILNTVFAQDITIKFATLAPEGSGWMNLMNDFNKAVQQATAGKVKFKIYSGGVQGDEKDVLRKIRIGQLHSAGFTGVGLGEILPEVRVLDCPFLFKNHAEIDFIADKFFDRFAAKFEEKEYVLLGFSEVGWVYIYTNTPVKTIADFKGVKMWMWEGDPLAEATFRAFGISPIPLSVTDVLTSLQTGLIDGVYTSPLACIGLQWFTKTRYIVGAPLTNANGAVLLSKKIYEKLTPEQQIQLKQIGREYFSKLTRTTRIDNDKSIEEMMRRGMIKIDITDSTILQQFDEIGKKTRQALAGRLYDQQLLSEIELMLSDFRKQSGLQ